PEGQADQKPVQKQDQLPAEAAYRPTFLAEHIALNRSAGNRVSTDFVQRSLSLFFISPVIQGK
ncbi:hypothetical protein QN369_24030, partial [Pseudomonas sp. CCI1.4]